MPDNHRMSDPMPAPPDPDEATLELINAEITASLARQLSSSQRLDNKAILLTGYSGAAASFLATQHPRGAVLSALAWTAYAAAAATGVMAYAVRLYRDVPEPRQLFSEYLHRTRAQTLAALAATRVGAFERNVSTHARKVRLWQASLIFLAVGLILMILALTARY